MAWVRTHTVTAIGLEASQIWKIWSDIDRRSQWDIDTEWAKLEGPFVKGATFYFKPKGGPKLSMQITECVPNSCFTDCFKIPFARMYGVHQVEPTESGIKIITSIKVEGALGWLMRKLVAEKVVAELPEQTELLIKLAKQEQP